LFSYLLTYLFTRLYPKVSGLSRYRNKQQQQ
jgi:hypothetical protein